MKKCPSLALVYVRWSDSRGDAPLVTLTEHLMREADTPVGVCVVDNRAGIPPVVAEIPGLSTIRGQNSEREFSGYESGVRHIRGCGVSPDLWLLANDRFDAYGLDDLDLLGDDSFAVAASLPCALGHVDRWPAPVHLLGFDVSSWARSNLLVVPDGSLQLIGSLVSVDASTFSSLLRESPPTPCDAANAALVLRDKFGLTWSALTAEWLTGVGKRLGEHWYQAAPIDQSNWSAFRGKVHSIANEQLLSARLRESGTPVVSSALAALVGSLPTTAVRKLTSSAIRRWPARSVAVAGRHGVLRAVRCCASVESTVRAGLRGVLR
jgi:hypothetical protein